MLPQPPDIPAQKAVGIEAAFLDIKRRIVLYEVPYPVILYSMSKDQVLRCCGRTDGVRLDESLAVNGGLQCGRIRECVRNRVSAQLLPSKCHA